MTQTLFFYCDLLGWFHEDKLTDPPTGCKERYFTWRGLIVGALQSNSLHQIRDGRSQNYSIGSSEYSKDGLGPAGL